MKLIYQKVETNENLDKEVVADKNLKRQIEQLQLQKMMADKVVSLQEFKTIKKEKNQKPSILVVDDDEVMRNALKRILDQEGYKVILAEDGLSLSKAMEEHKFDLSIIDINLPWVDGFELCQLIKSNPSLKKLPVLLISAQKTKDHIQKAFEVGCNDFIAKPFEVDNLVETIKKNIVSKSA